MLSRELKLGIIGGIISSVLMIFFIQPILSFVWSVVLSIGESVQAGYVDRNYRNAAVGERNLIGQLSLFVLILILTFVPTAFLMSETTHGGDVTRNVSRTFYFVASVLFFVFVVGVRPFNLDNLAFTPST